jgi:2'-5' RNA ligase
MPEPALNGAEGKSVRAFVALPVPTAAITYALLLQGVFHDQGIAGRCVRSEAMHITVEFLGDQGEAALDAYGGRLGEISQWAPAPVLGCTGPDTFGRPPSVVFVGWDDRERRFRQLADAVREASREVGLAPPAGQDKRKPVPHLTFLRVKDPTVQKSLRKLQRQTPEGPQWKPFLPPTPSELRHVSLDRMVLMSSTLTPDGPVYKPLREYRLPAAGGPNTVR